MLRARPGVLVLISILFGASACGSDPIHPPAAPPPGATLCESSQECAANERCNGGVCEAPRDPEDAAVPAPDARIVLPIDDAEVGIDAQPIDPDASQSGSDVFAFDATAPQDAAPDAGMIATYDLAGFQLVNRETGASNQTAMIPAGIVLVAGQSVVIARNADRAAFEAAWGHSLGRSLFFSTGAQSRGVPIINGGEKWELDDLGGHAVDGPTTPAVAARCFQRHARTPGVPESWNEVPESSATPGEQSGMSGAGLVITEWCDRSGTGQFIYEFIELTWLP